MGRAVVVDGAARFAAIWSLRELVVDLSQRNAWTPDELSRIDRLEASAFSALFAAAAPELGTGTQPIGDVLAMWHPLEAEAGYSYLLNFHLATDPDDTFERGVSLLREHNAPIIGIPVERRNTGWGTDEHLSELGLTYESDELIWAARIDAARHARRPDAPAGFEIVESGIEIDELAVLINEAWELPAGHSRGTLYASCLRIPDWFVLGVREAGELAGVMVASFAHGVCYLMLAMVRERYRGRGLQSYFIARRLHEGAVRGCDLAISETNDDNASPRNLQRAGFSTCIARRVYSRSLT